MLYLIGFFQRVAPAVITAELMSDFALNATALGNLSAFYFYSYVAMQVPTGVLADHWGPRRLLIAGAFIAAMGTLVFAMASNVWWANLGRLFIGGSVAVAFVCMLKLSNHWLPAKQVSLATGMALFTGVVGAVFAGVPLHLLVDAFGWRLVMLVIAGITCLIAIAIWWIVYDDPQEKGYASYAVDHNDAPILNHDSMLNGITKALQHRNVWFLYLISGGVVGNILTFAGLWGVPFLTTHYGMDKTTAAILNSALLVAFALGGPVIGWLSDQIGRRKPLYVIGVIVVLIGWMVILRVPDLELWLLVTLLLVVGFASGCMILTFAFAKESAPIHLAGTASGIVNMGVMMGPMLLQPAVGWMLDQRWNGNLAGGERLYSLDAYHAGFSLMLGWLVLSLMLILMTRETYCKQIV